MTAATVFFAALFYIATAVLLIGLIYKIRLYWGIPNPLVIPTTPAPTNRIGVVMRMFREVVYFESLFKANKWIWLFGWVFHLALLLIALRHLRYFTEPMWLWVVAIQWLGVYAGIAMMISLVGLWVRRLTVDRVRYISAPSDHLILALLFGIIASGLLMKYFWHTDIVALKAFLLGLMYFDWHPLPADPPLLIHLSLVVGLMIVFPFSKLLHAPGLFFSPTRVQIDDPREHRHITPWAGGN